MSANKTWPCHSALVFQHLKFISTDWEDHRWRVIRGAYLKALVFFQTVLKMLNLLLSNQPLRVLCIARNQIVHDSVNKNRRRSFKTDCWDYILLESTQTVHTCSCFGEVRHIWLPAYLNSEKAHVLWTYLVVELLLQLTKPTAQCLDFVRHLFSCHTHSLQTSLGFGQSWTALQQETHGKRYTYAIMQQQQ